MSDDLRQMLQHENRPNRPAVNPRLRTVPRVQGGLPLDGGPRLELDLPAHPPAVSSQGNPGGTGGPHGRLARPKPSLPGSESASRPGGAEAGRPDGPQLKTVGLTKSYRKAQIEIPVLRGVDIEVRAGEFLAVVGQSGSGKSTLLHLLCTLDAPDTGEIHFEGRRIDRLPAAERDRLRNRRFGMIFQFYHLLPEMSTLENVLSPLMIRHGVWNYLRYRRAMRQRAGELLDLVGLSHRLKHKPRELSGGEMQRAAIARALITQPDLLLADEPTGNLDHGTGTEILNLLRTLNDEQGLTIVMVTHDPVIAQLANRPLRLVDGKIQP